MCLTTDRVSSTAPTRHGGKMARAEKFISQARSTRLQPPGGFAGKIHFRFYRNHVLLAPSCPMQRDVRASSRTSGAGCGGRVGLQRSFFAPTNIPTRTVKSCGPGLPVLRPSRRQRLRVAHAMMFRITRTTGAIKPVPEESAYKPSNIAQGMPDDPAPPVVPAASFLSRWRAMGEAFTRHSLRPLVLEGG
jgi:hypothetical protein